MFMANLDAIPVKEKHDEPEQAILSIAGSCVNVNFGADD
jgi:hypothetical protein